MATETFIQYVDFTLMVARQVHMMFVHFVSGLSTGQHLHSLADLRRVPKL